MADFIGDDLKDSRFERVNLAGTRLNRVDLTGAEFRSCALTDESLAGDTTAVDAPGWPEPISFPVRECLLVMLNEEWEHRPYAERDLGVLIGHGS